MTRSLRLLRKGRVHEAPEDCLRLDLEDGAAAGNSVVRAGAGAAIERIAIEISRAIKDYGGIRTRSIAAVERRERGDDLMIGSGEFEDDPIAGPAPDRSTKEVSRSVHRKCGDWCAECIARIDSVVIECRVCLEVRS